MKARHPTTLSTAPAPRTVLVTGAGGLLGHALCRVFAEQGHRVIGQTRASPVDPACAAAPSFSLEDAPRVFETCARFAPDWIVHAAANTDVDDCERRPVPAWRLHVDASATLAAAAARIGARLLYVSTDSVYDGESVGPQAESAPVRPVNIYARTKLAGEEACLAAASSTLVARVNFFSLDPEPRRGLAAWILDRLAEGCPFNGFEDVTFSPLSAEDLARALASMLALGLPAGIYNAGAGDACSKLEFARRLAALIGADPSLVRPARLASACLGAPRPRNTSMDTRLLSARLGRPLPDIVTALRRAVDRAGLRPAPASCA